MRRPQGTAKTLRAAEESAKSEDVGAFGRLPSLPVPGASSLLGFEDVYRAASLVQAEKRPTLEKGVMTR